MVAGADVVTGETAEVVVEVVVGEDVVAGADVVA